MSSAQSLDLPIPASPDSSTTWPSPVLALAQRRNSSPSSSSRPTNAVRLPECIASKRLSTELARSTAQFEEIAEEPARGLGYDDRVRLGNGLKACREVRCLPDDIVFLPFAGPHKVPDYHHSGGSSYPHL